MRRNWIKLYIEQTLKGSMISELTPEQRWIFIGLLLLAGDSSVPGLIFGRKDDDGNLIGYANGWLAYTLGVEETSIAKAIEKMVAKEKVRIDARGVISVSNWGKYQSEYMRQKPYREGEKTACNESYKTACNESAGKSYVADREGEGDRDREEERVVGRKPSDTALSVKKDIIAKWNRFAEGHDLPSIEGIGRGSTRERHLHARMNEEGFDFEKVLKAIHEQPFLYGDNDRGWLVTFDWILKPANLTKVLEGAYIKNRIGDAARRAPEDPRVGASRR